MANMKAPNLDTSSDRVAAMFRGKNIFITGGTGFLGKVLIEKLLRTCPQLNTIYLLVRVKKDKDPKQRVHELFNSPIFETLRKARPECTRQVHVIAGDVTSRDLGISDEDKKLLVNNVHFIYHCAASIRFDETLKNAILLNTRGTKFMLDLALECKHLECFAHVSTAYSQVDVPLVEEKLYKPPPPANPRQIMESVEWMDDTWLRHVEREVLKSVPNTYVYSKAMSESLVGEMFDKLPCIIARPSIVLPIWKEPLPGWTDNKNGPLGLMIAGAKGLARTMCGDGNLYADFVPADLAINNLILATWNYVYHKDVERRIYNLTTSSEIKVTWQQIIDYGLKISWNVPLNNIVWYPGGSFKKSRLLHQICLILFHWIPAYFLDAIIYLSGNKPCVVYVQKRITSGLPIFEYYTSHQWEFSNDNVKVAESKLNEVERSKYYFKIYGQGPLTLKYFEQCTHCARLYLLNETPDTLPAAKRHFRIMYYVHIITQVLFYYLLFRLVVSYSETASNAVDYMMGYTKNFVPPSILGSN